MGRHDLAIALMQAPELCPAPAPCVCDAETGHQDGDEWVCDACGTRSEMPAQMSRTCAAISILVCMVPILLLAYAAAHVLLWVARG